MIRYMYAYNTGRGMEYLYRSDSRCHHLSAMLELNIETERYTDWRETTYHSFHHVRTMFDSGWKFEELDDIKQLPALRMMLELRK